MKALRLLFLCAAMLFCITGVAQADWDPCDPNKMHFPQLPDEDGFDVCLHEQYLADDFVCGETGTIDEIHIQVSFKDDQVLELSDPTIWDVSIRALDTGAPGTIGAILWQYSGPNPALRHYGVGQQGWHCPSEEVTIMLDHDNIWQVNFMNLEDPFTQIEGTTYWLVIKVNVNEWPPAVGWKTADLGSYPQPNTGTIFQSYARWALPPTGGNPWVWNPISIPAVGFDNVDLAFVISGEGISGDDEYDYGDAPDQPYPTLSINNGAVHKISSTFMGATVDGEADGQPTPLADGDDMNPAAGPDDEDGVTFDTALIPGLPAQITVISSTVANLDAWIDYDGVSAWGAAEQINGASIPVNPGANIINFTVPAGATIGTTFARFRLSPSGGLQPTHMAGTSIPDGEVEDYMVTIEEGEPVDPNVKYVQLPDLSTEGIDIRVDAGDGVTRHIADDFPCTTTGPITDVHFWGSWKDDEKLGLGSITVRFYTDDPIGLGGSDPCNTYSKPDVLQWEKKFPAGEFDEWLYYSLPSDPDPLYEWWWDPYFGDINSMGDQNIWQYDIYIDPCEAFVQQGEPTAPIIYWLEIEAFTSFQMQGNKFGWKTRDPYDGHYMDDAVFANGSNYPWISGWSELHYPATHPYHQGSPADTNSIDMAFMITTGYEPEPDDPNIKYIQPPDEAETGIDIRCDREDGILRTLADDFPCTQTGPITDVHLQGSWNDDYKGQIEFIHLSIHEDIPDPDPQDPISYSMPGNLLWEHDFFPPDFNETLYKNIDPLWEAWWDPYTSVYIQQGDQQIWKYDIYIDPEIAFIQRGTEDEPKVYWLDVWVKLMSEPQGTQFGWKTSRIHWNDAAVWDNSGIWQKLTYPLSHQYEGADIDMAFAITTDPNWECFSSGHPDHPKWVVAGKPTCWCYTYQCRGDADGIASGDVKNGYFQVGALDLGILQSAWQIKELPHGPGVSGNQICADFDRTLSGDVKNGYFHVGALDLGTLQTSWQIKNPPVGPGLPAGCGGGLQSVRKKVFYENWIVKFD